METTADSFDPAFFDGRIGGLSGRPAAGSLQERNEDDALMAAAARGNDEAFRRLVERHQERVYRFCHQWLRQSEDAREACQDTFVRVYQSLGRYRARGRFTSWLLKIAINQCRDRFRSKASRQARCTDSLGAGTPAEPECHRASPAEAASLSADVQRIRQGIDRLPAKLRDAVIVCGVEGYSHAQGAEILGCSERAIEGRLYRARKSLETWWRSESP